MLKERIEILSHRIQTLTEMISENCKQISNKCRHDDTRFNYGLQNVRGIYSREATMKLLILLRQTSNELRLLLEDPDFYWGNQLQVVKE